MAVLYKTAQSILANKDGKKLFYPRVVLKGNVSTDQIAQEIAEYSSLSKGDTKKCYRQPGEGIDYSPAILGKCNPGRLRHISYDHEVERQRRGKRRQGISCASHHDRALPALLHQESGPYRSYPLDGDRSEMYSLRNKSGRRFRRQTVMGDSGGDGGIEDDPLG